VADRSERRAQQAMRLALLYPEPDKGHLGKTIKRARSWRAGTPAASRDVDHKRRAHVRVGHMVR
jgi:hypothetical protein